METEADKKLQERHESAKAKSKLQCFFEVSPIHGCSYIGFRASIYEAIFWSIALLVSLGFCIHDLVELTEQYVNEVTTVSVVLQRNETFAYTDAAVCFDVFRHQLANSINAAFNEASFNASLQSVAKQLNTSAGHAIDLSTLPLNDTNVDIVLKTTYLLIVSIVDYDIGTPGGGGSAPNPPTLRAIELVDAFFQQQGYGYVQLSQQTARYMCKQATYGNNCSIAVSGEDNLCIDICATATVNWIGYTMAFAPFDDICFALNTPAMNMFRSSGDIFVFTTILIDRMSLLVQEWNESSSRELKGYGGPHISFDMRGWRGLMDPREMDSLTFIADTTGFLIGVEIESEFQAFNHSWGTCGKLPLSDCALFSCLPAARMAADGCWPLAGYSLTAASKPPQIPVCGSRYLAAQIKQLGTSYVGNWQTCIFNKCTFPPCNAFVYNYEVSFTSYNPTGGVNATLYQGKLSYAIFEEFKSMDFNAYFAAVGGSLALWLGASLLAIVHIPVYFLAALVGRWSMRRRATIIKVQPVVTLRTVAVAHEDKAAFARELVTG